MSANEIPFKITADTRDFQDGVKKAAGSLKDLEEKGSASISALTKGLTMFAGAAVLGALLKGLKDSVAVAAEAEVANVKLAAALKATGKYSEMAVNGMQAWAAALQRTNGVNDDVAKSMVAQAVSMGKNVEQSQRLVAAASNMAPVVGSLESAFNLLLRASDGNVAGLSRYGIKVTEAEKKTGDFESALRQAEQQFSGQAAAAVGTYAGQVELLGNELDTLQENIGRKLLPTATRWLSWVNEAIERHRALTSAVEDLTTAELNREMMRLQLEKAQAGTLGHFDTDIAAVNSKIAAVAAQQIMLAEARRAARESDAANFEKRGDPAEALRAQREQERRMKKFWSYEGDRGTPDIYRGGAPASQDFRDFKALMDKSGIDRAEREMEVYRQYAEDRIKSEEIIRKMREEEREAATRNEQENNQKRMQSRLEAIRQEFEGDKAIHEMKRQSQLDAFRRDMSDLALLARTKGEYLLTEQAARINAEIEAERTGNNSAERLHKLRMDLYQVEADKLALTLSTMGNALQMSSMIKGGDWGGAVGSMAGFFPAGSQEGLALQISGQAISTMLEGELGGILSLVGAGIGSLFNVGWGTAIGSALGGTVGNILDPSRELTPADQAGGQLMQDILAAWGGIAQTDKRGMNVLIPGAVPEGAEGIFEEWNKLLGGGTGGEGMLAGLFDSIEGIADLNLTYAEQADIVANLVATQKDLTAAEGEALTATAAIFSAAVMSRSELEGLVDLYKQGTEWTAKYTEIQKRMQEQLEMAASTGRGTAERERAMDALESTRREYVTMRQEDAANRIEWQEKMKEQAGANTAGAALMADGIDQSNGWLQAIYEQLGGEIEINDPATKEQTSLLDAIRAATGVMPTLLEAIRDKEWVANFASKQDGRQDSSGRNRHSGQFPGEHITNVRDDELIAPPEKFREAAEYLGRRGYGGSGDTIIVNVSGAVGNHRDIARMVNAEITALRRTREIAA